MARHTPFGLRHTRVELFLYFYLLTILTTIRHCMYNSFLISLAAVKNLNQRNYIVRTSEKRNQSDHVIKRWQCHIHKINIRGFILTT